MCVSLFLIKLQASSFRVCNFIKKRIQHKYFPAKLAKFLRTPILKNICERLLSSTRLIYVSFIHILLHFNFSYSRISSLCPGPLYFNLLSSPTFWNLDLVARSIFSSSCKDITDVFSNPT